MPMSAHRHSGRMRVAAVVAGSALVLAACGSSPTDSAEKTGGGGGGKSGLDKVYKAVEGLTGDARFTKLRAMAKKEGGKIGFYHSGDMKSEVAGFEKKTGLQVADYQATSERVAERVNNENKAGRRASDVVLGGSSDMVALHGEGAIATLDSPVTDHVTADFKTTDMVDPLAIMMMPTRNTKAVKAGDLPTDWTDFFKNFSKRKAIELTDWEWFATLVIKYFEAQKHMTEAAALALIRSGLKGATAVDGHTLVAQLLASGQYDYVPNLYAQYVPDLVKDGAPLSYTGVSKQLPPMLVTLFMGLTAGSPHPAGGLLLFEYMMSAEGQSIVASKGYVAPADTYKGTSLFKKYPYAMVSTVWQETPSFQKKWKKNYDTIIKGAGATKR